MRETGRMLPVGGLSTIGRRAWRVGGLLLAVGIALLWTMPLIWSVIASLRPQNEPFARGQRVKPPGQLD